jgi:hypothetical protein
MESNVDYMAKHYAEVINSVPNAWGQYISPIYGQSHNIMKRMVWLYGIETTKRALDRVIGKKTQ